MGRKELWKSFAEPDSGLNETILGEVTNEAMHYVVFPEQIPFEMTQRTTRTTTKKFYT